MTLWEFSIEILKMYPLLWFFGFAVTLWAIGGKMKALNENRRAKPHHFEKTNTLAGVLRRILHSTPHL